MERLFSPCNRFYERKEETIEELYGNGRTLEQHVRELKLDVSTEELLSAEGAFTYADLYALLGKEDSGSTFAWVTRPTVFMRANGRVLLSSFDLLSDCTFSFIVDGKDIHAAAYPPTIYWRFAMLYFDWWQQAPFI
jgi:hypothetical protein